MKCSNCGRELTSADRYCPVCGQNNPSYVEPPEPQPAETYSRTPNYGTYNQSNNAYGYQQPRPYYRPYENWTIAILALVFSLHGLIPGLVLSIVGLSKYRGRGQRNMCSAALTVFIVETVIATIALTVWLIIWANATSYYY